MEVGVLGRSLKDRQAKSWRNTAMHVSDKCVFAMLLTLLKKKLFFTQYVFK